MWKTRASNIKSAILCSNHIVTFARWRYSTKKKAGWSVQRSFTSMYTMANVLSVDAFRVSSKAYCKLLLHAVKYPHRAVNGVLLADKKKLKENKTLQLVDCVPMFHLSIGLAPMLEVALVQVGMFMKILNFCVFNKMVSDRKILWFPSKWGLNHLKRWNCG